jgi:AcrR family transcriptional regulator
LLRNALIHLIPEKGYDAIKVRDITERATLNRATFYLHYRDKEDLLIQGMQQVLDELTSRKPSLVAEGDQIAVAETEATIRSDFEHVAENAGFYRAMLGPRGVWGFVVQLHDHFYSVTMNRLISALGGVPSGPLSTEFVLRYMSAAYVGLIRWWLEEDMPYTPEEIAKKLVWLYSYGSTRALGLEAVFEEGEEE